MLSMEIKAGEEVQVGEIRIRTKQTSSLKRTRVYIDAPKDVKIIRHPEKKTTVLKAVSEKAL